MTARRALVLALVIQSSIQGAAGSASLAELAPRAVVAGVSLLSAMLSSGTAAFVAATRWERIGGKDALAVGGPIMDDGGSGIPPGQGR